jgi:hypothetical protein
VFEGVDVGFGVGVDVGEPVLVTTIPFVSVIHESPLRVALMIPDETVPTNCSGGK